MGYLLKVDKTKQQINFLNCDNIDKWIDTCQEVTKSYDVIDDDIDLPIEGGVIKGGDFLAFTFGQPSCKFKLNNNSYTATSSPYYADMVDLGIDKLTDCSAAFSGSSLIKFIKFPDTSNVTNMENMFRGCQHLMSLNLSGWDVRNVENMDYMFYDCRRLISLDLSGWDMNKASFYDLFRNCIDLQRIILKGCSSSTIYKIRNSAPSQAQIITD